MESHIKLLVFVHPLAPLSQIKSLTDVLQTSPDHNHIWHTKKATVDIPGEPLCWSRYSLKASDSHSRQKLRHILA